MKNMVYKIPPGKPYPASGLYLPKVSSLKLQLPPLHKFKGSLTVWALYAYFCDSQNAAF